MSRAVQDRQEANVLRLKRVLSEITNPMTCDEDNLMNIITKVVMPQNVTKDFVKERVISDEVSVWSPMKKVQLKTWKSARKAVKHKLADRVVELKEDRTNFAGMLVVARSRPGVDLKSAIGQHEFTSLPRSLFAVTCELLPSTDKSKLMGILENLPTD